MSRLPRWLRWTIHNMNEMTCKLESRVISKTLLLLDLLIQPEGSSWPRDSWALSHWASDPSCRHRTSLSGMCPDLSNLCVHLSKLLVPGHYPHLTLFCLLMTKMNVTAEPEGPFHSLLEKQAGKGSPWLFRAMETFGLSRYLLFLTISQADRRPLLK